MPEFNLEEVLKLLGLPSNASLMDIYSKWLNMNEEVFKEIYKIITGKEIEEGKRIKEERDRMYFELEEKKKKEEEEEEKRRRLREEKEKEEEEKKKKKQKEEEEEERKKKEKEEKEKKEKEEKEKKKKEKEEKGLKMSAKAPQRDKTSPTLSKTGRKKLLEYVRDVDIVQQIGMNIKGGVKSVKNIGEGIYKFSMSEGTVVCDTNKAEWTIEANKPEDIPKLLEEMMKQMRMAGNTEIELASFGNKEIILDPNGWNVKTSQRALAWIKSQEIGGLIPVMDGKHITNFEDLLKKLGTNEADLRKAVQALVHDPNQRKQILKQLDNMKQDATAGPKKTGGMSWPPKPMPPGTKQQA